MSPETVAGTRWAPSPSPSKPKPTTVPFPEGFGSVSVAGCSSTSPDGSSFRPTGAAANGEPWSERSGVAVIVVPSDTAPAGIASCIPSTAIVPPSEPTGALTAAASSATAAVLPSKRTVSAIRPTCPPGLRATTVTSPTAASAGTRKLARLPVAERTATGSPPTVILTFGPPKPLPVIDTIPPRSATAGEMELIPTAADQPAAGPASAAPQNTAASVPRRALIRPSPGRRTRPLRSPGTPRPSSVDPRRRNQRSCSRCSTRRRRTRAAVGGRT